MRWSGCQRNSSKDSHERQTCQVVTQGAELSTISYRSTSSFPGLLKILT
jgi:hypothetical protein